MRRVVTMIVCSLVAVGCSEHSDDADSVLETALVGTRPTADEASGTSTPRPLAGAEPHHLHVSGLFVLNPGGGAQGRALRITRDIYRGKGRAFRITDNRQWTDPVVAPEARLDGRESVYDGEHLAVRRRWGPWMDRETLGGQQERLLKEAHDISPAVLGAFGPYLLFRPDPVGETTLAGLKVKWEQVTLDTTVAPRPMEPAALEALHDHTENWKAWLAATHAPQHVEGRIARRVDGNRELVAGELTIEGVATWKDTRRGFLVQFRYDVRPLTPQVFLTLPEERLPAKRQRPWKMVKGALGDDLLPPYRR